MEIENRIIKSYVWHGDKCFFVSTIDRDSSSMEGGRYAETMVWEHDWKTNQRMEGILSQTDAPQGSIREHIRQVTAFHETGEPANED
jgi:hypothetical protein